MIKDNKIRRELLFGLGIIIIVIICSSFYIDKKLQDYQKDEFLRYANVLGSIKNEIENGKIHKDSDITFYFINDEYDKENTEIGVEALSKYGYFKDKYIYNKWIGTKFLEIKKIIISMIIVVMIIISIIFFFIMYNFNKRINVVSDKLEDLSLGNEFVELEARDDGSISKLYHHYNMTGSRMRKWIGELEKERNLIKGLLNDLSHQLKTPLASIKINNEIILEGYTDEKETKEFIINNSENINRLEWITEGLIQLSRLETYSINLIMKDQELKETLIVAINSVYGKGIEKDIKINILNIDEFRVLHDKKWTAEAIINIIDNAIKYSNKGSNINISMKSEVWKSEIIIEDFGIGIKKEEIDCIFKRFYRGVDGSVQKVEGSGIGLYLSKKIIENQNGNIKVESKLGQGSKFVITLYKHILN